MSKPKISICLRHLQNKLPVKTSKRLVCRFLKVFNSFSFLKNYNIDLKQSIYQTSNFKLDNYKVSIFTTQHFN